jgi:hypothetical protein
MDKLLKALQDLASLQVTGGQFQPVFKSLADAYGSADVAKLVLFAKGLIGPEAIRAGNVLTPQQSKKIISLIFDSDFLKKITTQKMTRLKFEGTVLDIPSRSMRRRAQGSEPGDNDKVDLNNFNYTLTAEDMQLFADLTKDFLRNNADNPGLAGEVEAMLAKRLRGELVDLAFNGEASDYAGDDAAFLGLNEGWVKIAMDAKTAGDAKGGVIDPATDGWFTTLGNLWELVPDQVKSSAIIHMNTGDADKYAEERAVNDAAIRSDSERARKYLGYPIEPVSEMPKGSILITPQKNLVFGLNGEIERAREYNARKGVLEYTFDLSADYEIAVKQFVVIGHPAAA